MRAVLGIRASKAEMAYYSKQRSFDQPLYVQYGKWLWQLLHGNFGYDIKNKAPVWTLMWNALPRTIVLAVIGTGVGLLIGIPLGIFQAVPRHTVADNVLTGYGIARQEPARPRCCPTACSS